MRFGKKGAQEMNMIIFIILALIVAGLVIWFSYGFFGTGTRLIDGNDPSVQIAIESCKAEMRIQESAYCNSAKTVKIKGGEEMIVNCEFLNENIQKGFIEESGLNKPDCEIDDFIKNQCSLINQTTDELTANKTRISGKSCSDSGIYPWTA
jgi:hypothetical protein